MHRKRITIPEVSDSGLSIVINYYSDYAKIALENYDRIQELLKKRKIIDNKYKEQGRISEEEDMEYGKLSSEIGIYSRVVVIFCGLALEAFINNYAIRNLSRNYFDKYLDKLDLMSKWIVIPRLLIGSQLDLGSQPLQDLNWLIKQRNELVHFKSKTVPVSRLGSIKFFTEKDAQKAILTVKSLALALHKIDRRANETWLYYRDTWFPSKRLETQ